MTCTTITVNWGCGHYINAPYWQKADDWVYESDTCEAQFDTQECLTEWNEESCSATCPNCKADLWQSDGHAEAQLEPAEEEPEKEEMR